MAKAIMLSIKPKYVSMILNKTKTIEVRKRFPLNYRGWVYIYCTKEDTLSILTINSKDIFTIGKDFVLNDFGYLNSGYEGKGKVVARFYCDETQECEVNINETPDEEDTQLLNMCCLSIEELANYSKGKNVVLVHISQLEIFDKPKELSEFKIMAKTRIFTELSWLKADEMLIFKECLPLTKAPQSYMYIEVEE